MTASEHRARARAALKGNWMWAALTTLVASLLGGVATTGGSTSVKSEYTESIPVHDLESLGNYFADYIPLIVGGTVIGLAVSVIFLMLGSVVGLGYRKYTLNLIDGESAEFKQLFSRFHRLWPAVRMRLLQYAITIAPLIAVALVAVLMPLLGGLLVLVWLVGFIYVTYGFEVADFIMAEDETCGARDALRRSWTLMDGRRWEFFCLELSFIGWSILAGFTFGIGGLFLTPYTQVANASFYREMKPKAGTHGPDDGYTDYAGVKHDYL